MIKIIVTDGYTLNPGDMSWGSIEKFGQLTVYDRMNPGELVDKCREADIVLTNKVPFSEATIAQLPNLKMIGVTATGYNIVDIEAAKIIINSVTNYSNLMIHDMRELR